MMEWLLDSLIEIENVNVTDFTFSLDGDIIPDRLDPIIDYDSNLLDDRFLEFLDVNQDSFPDLFDFGFSLDQDLIPDLIDPVIVSDDPFQDLDENCFFDTGYAEYYKNLQGKLNVSLGALVYE